MMVFSELRSILPALETGVLTRLLVKMGLSLSDIR